ncbi:MAG: pentapeptide repeat-containing protein [Anaerolineae bacterium]
MDEQELIEKYNAGEREFSKAYLVRADLSGAVLSEANLSEAPPPGRPGWPGAIR